MHTHYNFIKTYLTNTIRPTFTDLSAVHEPEIATRSRSMACETSADLQNAWILLYNSIAVAERPKSAEEPSANQSSVLFKRVFTQVAAGKPDFQPESSTSYATRDTKANLAKQDPKPKSSGTLCISNVLCKRASILKPLCSSSEPVLQATEVQRLASITLLASNADKMVTLMGSKKRKWGAMETHGKVPRLQ